jgi:hypothetical protein
MAWPLCVEIAMTYSLPRRALLVATLAVGAGGCSLVFVRGPAPDTTSSEKPACTRSLAPPIADLLMAAPLAGSGLILGILCVSSESCIEEHPEILGGSLLAVAVGVPLFISARVGFDRVNRCAEAHLRHEIKAIE